MKPKAIFQQLFDRPLLIIGDGDFSFSKRIVMYGNTNVVTSNLILPEPNKSRGPLKYLHKKGIKVLALDATTSELLPERVIVWCFPFSVDPTVESREILMRFFRNCYAQGINEIILGLKSIPDDPKHQYNYWKLSEIHNKEGYEVVSRLQSPIFWNVTDVQGRSLPQSSGLVEFICFKWVGSKQGCNAIIHT